MTGKFGGGYNVAAPPASSKTWRFSRRPRRAGRYGIPGDIRGFDLKTAGIVALSHRASPEPNFGTWGPDGWQTAAAPAAGST
jgi:hypothetical protein